MTPKRTLVALAAVALIPLANCSSEAEDARDAPTSPTGTAAAATTTTRAAPSTTTTAPAPALPAKLKLIRTIAPADGFDELAFLSIDEARDRIYVADSDNRRIVSFARDGTDPSVIEADNVSLNFRLHGSLGAVDVDTDGNLYVAESGTARILRMTPQGEVLSKFKAEPAFGRLFSLSVDRVNGLVYAVDDELDTIVVFDRSGTEVRRVAGPGSAPGEVNDLGSVEVLADGTFWVADAGNGRVQHLTAHGSVLQVIGPFAEGEAGYVAYPNDVAIDQFGRIWAADYLGGAVVVFGPDGTPLASFSADEASDGEASDGWMPVSLTFDDAGNLYLAERSTDAVYVYATS